MWGGVEYPHLTPRLLFQGDAIRIVCLRCPAPRVNVFAAPATLLSGCPKHPQYNNPSAHSPIALLPRAAFVCMIAA